MDIAVGFYDISLPSWMNKYYLLLSIITHYYPLFFINYDPLLSIVIHYYLFFSMKYQLLMIVVDQIIKYIMIHI